MYPAYIHPLTCSLQALSLFALCLRKTRSITVYDNQHNLILTTTKTRSPALIIISECKSSLADCSLFLGNHNHKFVIRLIEAVVIEERVSNPVRCWIIISNERNPRPRKLRSSCSGEDSPSLRCTNNKTSAFTSWRYDGSLVPYSIISAMKHSPFCTVKLFMVGWICE